MEKQQQLKKLKMKYFWEQKFEEVSKVVLWCILIVSGGVFLPYWFGRFMVPFIPLALINELFDGISLYTYWAVGVLSLGITFLVVVIIGSVIENVRDWISSNLDKAESRAMKELKMNKKMKGGSQ